MKATTDPANSDAVGDVSKSPGSESNMRPLDQALPFKMLRAREAMLQRFRPLMQDRKITEQQWRIIRVLASIGDAEILTLSEWCVIHPASLSRMLPKMETAGLISRRAHEGDRRRVIVSLTDAGRGMFENVGPESEAVYESIAADVGHERIKELYRILDDVIVALNPQRRSGAG